jgi:hypothetical protein
MRSIIKKNKFTISKKRGLTINDINSVVPNTDIITAVCIQDVNTYDSRIVKAQFEPNSDGEPGGILWLFLDKKIENRLFHISP